MAVPRRQNQDDAKMDGERFKGDVVIKIKTTKRKMEEKVPVPNSVYITREDLEEFGFTARCAGCMSLLKG